MVTACGKGGLSLIPDPTGLQSSSSLAQTSPTRGSLLSSLVAELTEAEALDASDFAHSWLTETSVTEQDDVVRRFINGTLSDASAQATAAPWPEEMQFTYNEAHGRWLPVVPAAAEVVTPTTSGQSTGGTPLSSAVGGALQETPLPACTINIWGCRYSARARDRDKGPVPENGDRRRRRDCRRLQVEPPFYHERRVFTHRSCSLLSSISSCILPLLYLIYIHDGWSPWLHSLRGEGVRGPIGAPSILGLMVDI